MTGMDVSMEKAALRRLLKKRREGLDEPTWIAYGQAIVERLIAIVDWNHVRRVHCYIPIEKQNEVSTWPLFHYVWRQWPDIAVAMPGPLRSGEPTAFLIDRETEWRPTGAVPRPLVERFVPTNNFDLIIVPMLGFDHNCHRLGYGGGYYDRLLRRQPLANTVGLSFSCGFVTEGLPHERHDVRLRSVITEDQVYTS